jgi:SARP family transcriptional regulator, regulator of embCAB operon
LAEAIWKEPDPTAVDARLNPLLSKLRRVLGADALEGRLTSIILAGPCQLYQT